MAAKEPLAEIDFSRYRTEDLVDQLVELISVPGAIRKVLKTIGWVLLLATIACGLMRSYAELSLLPWLVCSVYALLAAVVFGGALGVLRVIRAGLKNIQGILVCSLDVTRKAADDYQKLGNAEVRLPSGSELLLQVERKVIDPALQRAVRSAFGRLGGPISWAYRRTIGSAVSSLVTRLGKSKSPEERENEATRSTLRALAGLNQYSARIESFANSATEMVERLGQRLRFYAMFPLWALYAVVLGIASVPVVVILYLGAQ
ncbi:hypothetical protein [Aeoliella mucimassa]|nr:hypothetical protein [Aeoliella mucimassa]